MDNLSPRTQGLIAINIAAVVFGSAALYGKLDISPFWIVGLRAGFAALALSVFGYFKKESIGVSSRDQWPPLLITGSILAVHWLMFFASVQISGVAVATLTFAAFPLFTVVIETFFERRRPRWAEIVAASAIIFAVSLLVKPANDNGNLLGIGAGIASAVTFAWFGYASKNLAKALSPRRISLLQNAVVFVLSAPCLFFAAPQPSHAAEWLWLILLGVVTTALMHQLYFYALKRLSASTCSGFVALEPVYAILFAAMIFQEPLTPWVGASALLIVGASFVLLKMEPAAAA